MNFKTTRITLNVVTLLLCCLMTGCANKGGFNSLMYGPWYDVYGNHCGDGAPRPGCNFFADGAKVRVSETYYPSGIDFKDFVDFHYVDSYGNPQTYTGWGALSNEGILFDYGGQALNEISEETQGRDLMAWTAEEEARAVKTVGRRYAETYALSETAGIRIAKTLNEIATFSHKMRRSKTESDIKDFSKRLFGIEPDRIRSAIDRAILGNPTTLIHLNSEVASSWGTTPETSQTILKRWYKRELSQVHIQE